MNKHRFLSKSRFTTALECPTKLFYYGKRDEYANIKDKDEFLQHLAEGGFQVHALAKYYHDGGHLVEKPDHAESLKETNEYLKQDNVIIYEAAIRYEDFFIRVDVLVKEGNDVQLIEVKSKSYNRNEDKLLNTYGYIDSKWKSYLYDVAFQTWVTKNAFPEWKITPYLMLADKLKSTTVDGLNQIFKIERDDDDKSKVIETVDMVTKELLGDEILTKEDMSKYVDMILGGRDKEILDFGNTVREYAKYYKSDRKYPVELGSKCKYCEYKNNDETREKGLKSGYEECWNEKVKDYDLTKPHIFEVWDYRLSNTAIENNKFYMEDLDYEDLYTKKPPAKKDDSISRVKRQWMQIEISSGKRESKEFIHSGLFDEIQRWKYPFHFIDFETCTVAIPFTAECSPYEQVAFQYSCHSLYENGDIVHNEWISVSPGVFPNFEFVKSLKNVLSKDNGTILQYSHYENTVLRQIRKQLEDKADQGKNAALYNELMGWIDEVTKWKEDEITGNKHLHRGVRCMVDMLDMVKKYYYHPLMKGSNSIKAVLPAVMNASKYLKEKYSQPLDFGSNLSGEKLWQPDPDTKRPVDPYKLLKEVCGGLKESEDDIDEEDDGVIASGGDAMTAYAELQFSDVPVETRKKRIDELKHYCELDTLAMLMVYEHWRSQKG